MCVGTVACWDEIANGKVVLVIPNDFRMREAYRALLASLDDDGMIVLVEAEATEYSMLLGYIRLLDDLPQFERVQILGLSQLTDADSGVSLLFSAQSGGETIDQSIVKMSIEITRIELETDEDQNFSDEELAVAGNQDTVPVPQ